MVYDFSGYATKNDLKCADGRTIRKNAFKDNDGQVVPLVWQHCHDDPTNVLGHAVLENREDGVYCYGKFNDTEKGKDAKLLVQHGDITALSIYANQLQQQGNNVLHGAIREVSIVLAGANPGAFIDNLAIQHGDGTETVSADEAVIFTGESISLDDLEHAEPTKPAPAQTQTQNKPAAKDGEGDKTMQEIFDTMNEDQKNVVYAMLAEAVGQSNSGEVTHSDEGGNIMKTNVFDQAAEGGFKHDKPVLTHDQLTEILTDAQKCGSLKDSFLSHAQTYGIENIDVLFPDAKTVTPTPDLIKRDTDWVQGFMSGTTHSPFARVKSTAADLTADAARAKGYVKASLKTEEVISLMKRTTAPTTVYKKQKLDRDDIVDITDLDVVAFLKAEMQLMLNEEIARAALVGDGRTAEDPDKIKDPLAASDGTGIRSVYNDDDAYAFHVQLPSTETTAEMIDDIVRARKNYKRSGNPVMYTTTDILTDMLLLKDGQQRRIYNTVQDLAAALRVSSIVEVPVMENMSRVSNAKTYNLKAILLNPSDYTFGADKGGNVGMFDDFDIDYNQYKYLIETRCSGGLTHPKSALVIEELVNP